MESSQTRLCPYCAETIFNDAIKCRHCSEMFDNRSRQAPHSSQPLQSQRKWIPGVAAVLSLVIPGAGQMYRGNIGTGIFWLILTIFGYFLFLLPGLILHIVCIVTAASGDPYQ